MHIWHVTRLGVTPGREHASSGAESVFLVPRVLTYLPHSFNSTIARPALSTRAHPHYLHKWLQHQVENVPGIPPPPLLTPIPTTLTAPRTPKRVFQMRFRP